MIKDSAPLSRLQSIYEQLIGANGFDNHWLMGRQLYKGGVDREVLKITTIKKTIRVPNKPYFGDSNVVELGGVFEEVGGDEQAIGGELNKIG